MNQLPRAVTPQYRVAFDGERVANGHDKHQRYVMAVYLARFRPVSREDFPRTHWLEVSRDGGNTWNRDEKGA